MPRFYFDLSAGSLLVGSYANRDADGYDLDSLKDAEVQARISASELARERLRTVHYGPPETIRVEVRDEHGQVVITVTVSLSVERVDLEPQVLHG